MVGLPRECTKIDKNGHHIMTQAWQSRSAPTELTSNKHTGITSNLGSNFWLILVHLIGYTIIPLPPSMTGSTTYPLPSVHFNGNWIVSATFDKIKSPLLCHARVTIWFIWCILWVTPPHLNPLWWLVWLLYPPPHLNPLWWLVWLLYPHKCRFEWELNCVG